MPEPAKKKKAPACMLPALPVALAPSSLLHPFAKRGGPGGGAMGAGERRVWGAAACVAALGRALRDPNFYT